MHELSIAMSIVELAQEELERRGGRINAVHLKLGALSGVVKEALLSSYEMACEDTPLQGSRLVFEEIPVVVFCSRCKDGEPSVRCSGFVAPNAERPRRRSWKAKSWKSPLWRYSDESGTSIGRSQKECSEAE